MEIETNNGLNCFTFAKRIITEYNNVETKKALNICLFSLVQELWHPQIKYRYQYISTEDDIIIY